jgi:hypothetical protein
LVSIAEIMPIVQALSRSEKLELARLIIDGLAKQESPPGFKEGHVYAIYTPEYAPGAAAQLAEVLKSFEPQR